MTLVDVFPHLVAVFLILSMMSEFGWYPWAFHPFCIDSMDPIITFYFSRHSPNAVLVHKSQPTFMGCGSIDNLLFRAFAVTVLVCSIYLVQLGLPLDPAGAS